MTDQEKTTTEKPVDPRFAKLSEEHRHLLHGYVGDAVAIDSEIEAALDRQVGMSKNDSLAGPAIRQFHDSIRDQRDMMIELRDAFGETGTGNVIKEKGAELMGLVGGIIDKIRSEGTSKALRDDYTAFNMGAISYTMLLTTAKSVGSTEVAAAAEKGLRTYAAAVQKINEILPAVLANELEKNEGVPQPGVADEVRGIVDKVWKQTSN
jgi:ferritin-like metal-binding protein YciE